MVARDRGCGEVCEPPHRALSFYPDLARPLPSVAPPSLVIGHSVDRDEDVLGARRQAARPSDATPCSSDSDSGQSFGREQILRGLLLQPLVGGGELAANDLVEEAEVVERRLDDGEEALAVRRHEALRLLALEVLEVVDDALDRRPVAADRVELRFWFGGRYTPSQKKLGQKQVGSEHAESARAAASRCDSFASAGHAGTPPSAAQSAGQSNALGVRSVDHTHDEEMLGGAAVWPVGHVAAARIWSESMGRGDAVADDRRRSARCDRRYQYDADSPKN